MLAAMPAKPMSNVCVTRYASWALCAPGESGGGAFHASRKVAGASEPRITPAKAKDQVWLEAYPRTSHYYRFQLICQSSDMSPYALRIFAPNGEDYAVYQFYDATVNAPKASVVGDSWTIPYGWQEITHELPMPHPKKKE